MCLQNQPKFGDGLIGMNVEIHLFPPFPVPHSS